MENQEDKVVVCRNPDCGRTSCRLCQRPSHVPFRYRICPFFLIFLIFNYFRCDEQRGNLRKQIEESLSDAIIRKCSNPQCSTTFLKVQLSLIKLSCWQILFNLMDVNEPFLVHDHQRKLSNWQLLFQYFQDEGCNRMICPKCKTMQCYVCKKTIAGYDHFHRAGTRDNNRTCPLYSDIKKLYAAEVNGTILIKILMIYLHFYQIQKATEKEVKDLKKEGIDINYDKNKGIQSSDLFKEDK